MGVWTTFGEDGKIKTIEYNDEDGVVAQYFTNGVLMRQDRINVFHREYEYNLEFNSQGFITNNYRGVGSNNPTGRK